MKELTKNAFTPVSEKQFKNELSEFPFFKKYKNWIAKIYDELNDEQFQIYVGDLKSDNILEFEALNVLVIGNIEANWLNAVNNYGNLESGSLFVTGNVDCEYFSNSYGKLIILGGSLNVSIILNNKFEDSSLMVQNDLVTEYFYGIDMWAEVGGKISIEYGDGYCLPIGYKNAEKQFVGPKHNEEESRKFLGLTEDKDDSMESTINDFIRNKVKIK